MRLISRDSGMLDGSLNFEMIDDQDTILDNCNEGRFFNGTVESEFWRRVIDILCIPCTALVRWVDQGYGLFINGAALSVGINFRCILM